VVYNFSSIEQQRETTTKKESRCFLLIPALDIFIIYSRMLLLLQQTSFCISNKCYRAGDFFFPIDVYAIIFSVHIFHHKQLHLFATKGNLSTQSQYHRKSEMCGSFYIALISNHERALTVSKKSSRIAERAPFL
jgi:hypothetical protein